MIAISMRRALCAIAVFAVLLVAAKTKAACCGGWGTTAYYPSTYNTYYAGSYAASYPAAYQTSYAGTGWYPGYYWDRIRTRLWGSPTTYVAAYPGTAYYASYAPSYGVSYAPTYAAASYSAPACASCSTCQSCTAGHAPCSTCGVQQVTLRPVCTTACSSPCDACASDCSGCSTCAGQVVTQTSYERPACATCNGSSTVHVEQGSSTTPSPDVATPPPTFGTQETTGAGEKPALPADSSVPGEQLQNKPPTNGAESQPGPGDDTETTPAKELYKVESTDSATMWEAPKLHDPNDRTAQRSIAPVKNALYKQPAGYRTVSMQRVSAEQARKDAIGWTSASK
jgi:hypothetical protein